MEVTQRKWYFCDLTMTGRIEGAGGTGEPGGGGGGRECRSDELHTQPEKVRLCASILVLPAGARAGWGHPKTFKFN